MSCFRSRAIAFFVPMGLMLVALAFGGLPRASAQEVHPISLTGSWNGGWYSQTTGHKGPLQAKIRPSNDGHYTATFTGKFFKVIPFRYEMKLNVVANDGNTLRLSGSKKLGPLMGYYSYHATVSGSQFTASYRTKRDQGTFSLRRR